MARHRCPTLAERLEFLQEYLRQEFRKLAKSQADLDAAIAGLPAQIESAVDAALAPVIAAIEAKANGTPVDFQSEVDQLNAIGATVAGQVTKDLTPAAPAPAAPAAPSA